MDLLEDTRTHFTVKQLTIWIDQKDWFVGSCYINHQTMESNTVFKRGKDIWDYRFYTLLSMEDEVQKRSCPTDEELSAGAFKEQIEPIVRDAVFAMRRKGYNTFCSGFLGIKKVDGSFDNSTTSTQFVIQIRDTPVRSSGPEASVDDFCECVSPFTQEEIRAVKQCKDINIDRFRSWTSIGVNGIGRTPLEIKHMFDQVASSLPVRGRPVQEIRNDFREKWMRILEGIMDGGSAQCSNKTCNVDKYHFCGMTGKYNTTGSPFHRVEEETS